MNVPKSFWTSIVLFLIPFYLLHSFLYVNMFAYNVPNASRPNGRLRMRRHLMRKSIHNRIITKQDGWKYILAWNGFYFRKSSFKKIFKRHFMHQCEEERCHITTDKRYLSKADAILFEGFSLQKSEGEKRKLSDIHPSVRNPNQIYIFFSQDPPFMYNNINLKAYDNFFNWTMTYRRDSDIVAPYGKILKRNKKRPPSEIAYVTAEELKNRAMAIWLESHCDVPSRRDKFVHSMQKYIEINVFGKCNNKTCGSNRLMYHGSVGRDSCEKTFPKYKFFMALENSFCRDYVTEKFYRSLNLGIIPVVLGCVNYTNFGPPNSFIDSKRFKSPNALARHMLVVGSNPNLYNKYLEWQEDHYVDVGFPYNTHICDLCKKLHSTSDNETKSYPSIHKWFIEDSNCRDPA